MIVTDTAHAAVHLGPGTQRVRTCCLARRGMLHSETEAVDHVRLSPGACYDLAGRAGTEAAWYVLRGPVALLDCPEQPQHLLAEGDLLLAPEGGRVHLHGGPLGAELLCLTVLPDAVSRELPDRKPEIGTPRPVARDNGQDTVEASGPNKERQR
ncbi:MULTISPECIES: hypothetical protein [unclassified Kitasatospora]|uniref:hypothetical protein n=1 Tax=unclassified Kitasatospora TaxID=2633591 RepID=UPI0007093EA1|nr:MULTISPECIES: hypothetical protein [unclassified Kitasatospora]KQV04504.1 hypothetical protein ASC99_13945 [Kitasatospora sp. Root107]KRB60966.1 hypothetical protein ASE03_11560 [Kitasatospora sp. Root187]